MGAVNLLIVNAETLLSCLFHVLFQGCLQNKTYFGNEFVGRPKDNVSALI